MNLEEAIAAEEAMPPGPYQVQAYLLAPLSREDLGELKLRLIESGVILKGLYQKGSVLTVKVVNPEPIEDGIAVFWLIPVAGILATTVGGWFVTKYFVDKTEEGLSKIAAVIIPASLILAGGLVLYGLAKD